MTIAIDTDLSVPDILLSAMECRPKRAAVLALTPNVRAKLPAEAGFVSPVRDDSTIRADRAYKACRSGSA
jgi:hypothetical protein